jgi:hypothetical protein
MSTATYPDINTAIAHLREVLGDGTYESLAHKVEASTPRVRCRVRGCITVSVGTEREIETCCEVIIFVLLRT